MVPPLKKLECSLPDANFTRKFVTVAHSDSNAPIRNEDAFSPQLSAGPWRVLDGSDHRSRPETSRLDHKRDQIDKFLNSPLLQMAQRISTFEANSIVVMMLKTKHNQASEETLMNSFRLAMLPRLQV